MCYDGDTVELISERYQRARKTHKCAECNRDIQPGERYLYECWTYDGDFDSLRTCEHCAEARRWIRVVCSSWLYHALLEELTEHWVEEDLLRSAGLGRLVVAMRNRWSTKGGQRIPLERVSHWVDEGLTKIGMKVVA